MRTYDNSFAIIARMRGYVTADDAASARSSVDRRREIGGKATIAQVLVDLGKIDAAKVSEIETVMKRHALECTQCAATTYILPTQDEPAVRCEQCGGATRRPSAAQPPAPASDPKPEAPRGNRMRIGPGSPAPEAAPAPAPERPSDVPEPRTFKPINFERETKNIPAGSAAAPNLLDMVNKVPRATWAVCALVCIVMGAQGISSTLKLDKEEAKIHAEIDKLNVMGNDVKAKSIEILKPAGFDVKPDEIQLCCYQNLKKDTKLFAYVTIRTDKLKLQVVHRLTSREALEISIANGFEWVEDHKEKIWVGEENSATYTKTVVGFALGMVFIVMTIKLGGG